MVTEQLLSYQQIDHIQTQKFLTHSKAYELKKDVKKDVHTEQDRQKKQTTHVKPRNSQRKSVGRCFVCTDHTVDSKS